MPPTLTYPGVYVEEIPSGVHPITGVATSITAFVGFAQRGPVNEPTLVLSFSDFVRVFGGLWSQSTMSQAVQQFFLNGGSTALIVRVAHLSGGTVARKGSVTVGGAGSKALSLEAANPGEWSDNLLVRLDHDTKDKDDATPVLFNLSIKDTSTGVVEVLRNLAPDGSLASLIEQQSTLVRAKGTLPTARPDADAAINPGDDPFDPAVTTRYTAFPTSGAQSGQDGDQAETDLVPASDDGTGVYALAKADLFNLLCIPPFLPASATSAGRVLGAGAKASAAAFCSAHRAVFLVDPHPDWTATSQITSGGTSLTTYLTISSDDRKNAALYFPYFRAPDSEQGGALADFPPCGAIAGVISRTDATRGVWKAPAGLDAGVAGVQELKAKLTDGDNGVVNPLAVNCLRTFPNAGTVVWGARTLQGADSLGSEWKYLPVRRTALFLEESLYRGTQWVVFEPNDTPLWAQIRLNITSFMTTLFRQGAFAGTTPRDAFFVKCDAETTTPDDVSKGIVNIVVGFAPLRPAEFVVIQLQQLAGQTGSA
jgi:Bacteriophage tail sheath protein